MWCLDHQTGRGQALSDLGVNNLGACIKVISGLVKSYFNRTLCNNKQHFCNEQRPVFVQKMASESHRNTVTHAGESWFIEAFLKRLCGCGISAGHPHVCVHQENFQSCSLSSQRVPGWLKKRQNDSATLIPQVVLEWTATKSILQFTTSSPVWALAAGVSRLVQVGTVKSWEKGTDFTFRTIHSTEELKPPGALGKPTIDRRKILLNWLKIYS